MKVKKTIKIPKRLNHEIIGNLGVGSYSTYGLGSMPGTVKKWWKSAGSKHDGGIATLGSAFLVAMTNTFGADGDVMQVHLKGGQSFWVIKCDTKSSGDSNWTKYGHNVDGTIDILEWYGDMSFSQLRSTLKKKKYLGKRISYVENYGRYKKNMKLTGGGGAVQKIIDVAKKHVGKNGRAWVKDRTSIGNQAWCAATMCACGIDAKFAGKIMPRANYSASGFGKDIVEKYKGTYIKGGKNAKPQPGDFAEFPKGATGKWASGHIGLVIKVNKTTVRTIEGNHLPPTGEICYVTRRKSEIGWYARPDWDKVGGAGNLDDGDGSSGVSSGPLYDTSSTRADAMMREVAYIDNKGVTTTKATDIELSVLNYTSLLAEIYSLYGGGSGGNENPSDNASEGDYDLTNIKNKVAKRVVKYFIDEGGFSPAGACAIAGNMQQESSFNPGLSDGTNFGLCSWTNAGGRADNMKKHAGSDWKKDVEGQCSFILKELKEGGSGYKKLLNQLKENKNSESWCKELTEKFCTVYERAGTPMMSNRKKYAVNVWKKIKKKKTAKYGGGKFKWPCPGHKTITSKFGPRSAPTAGASSYHRGIDISASIGDKVIAAASGKVIEVATSSSRGKYITISHGSKLYTRYQHLSKQSVKKGDKVNAGDTIGKVGNTGVGTGAHLHFEVLKGGYTGWGKYEVNPMKYLK